MQEAEIASSSADLFARVFPYDLRPQGHDIIRTWLFSTTVRSHFEHDTIPWSNCALSGWILDPDRKKMSKSKGNVVTPIGLFDQYGADAVRYWAACARPGTDTAFDEGQMKIGRKLAIKLLNASKFVIGTLGEGALPTADEASLTPLDCALLRSLEELVAEATAAFEDYDYARALERTETFFWSFCDQYVELAKARSYGGQGEAPAASAQATLQTTLGVLLRLFAPFLPFVTEEIWAWWQEGSIHQTSWPTCPFLPVLPGASPAADPMVYELAVAVLGEVRRAKTEAKLSLRAAVASVSISGTDEQWAAVNAAWADIADAGVVASLSRGSDADFAVLVTLEE